MSRALPLADPAEAAGVGPPTSVSRPREAVRATRTLDVARVALVGLGLFLVALAARLGALDTYVTIDESRWVQRASDFAMRIAEGDAAGTFIIGHPGVTTMWTAYLGLGPERARHFSYLEGTADATRREGYFNALLAARRPFVVLGALGVAVVTLLGWRLLGGGPASLGGLILALEPFLIAHARVAHLDSTLTFYTATSLLAALVFWLAGGHWAYLAISGLAAGLAFLTKAPSVFVVGFVPLVVGFALLQRRERSPRAWLRTALLLAAWVGLALAVCLALWPAFRANPVGTVLQMAQFTERVGGGDHDNFFLGQPLDDPGPLFYPLALGLRLAPAMLVGLVCLAVLWRRVPSRQRPIAFTLVAYCVGFGLMMSIAPKKFDRYLLPTFPLLGLLAGLGLWQVAAALGSRFRRRLVTGAMAVAACVLVAQAAVFAPVFGYPLAYYNPLLGGSALAQRAILVGWGEGLDRVAEYLNDRALPLGEPTVATSYHRVLQAQLRGSALPLERARMADYVVPYVNTLQRGAEDDILAPYLAATPEHTVRINGIEYARIYRGPHYPLGDAVGAEIGGRLTLLRYAAAPGSGDVRAGEEVSVLLRWDRPAERGEQASVALVGPDGRALVQDQRPVGADGPDENGQPGQLHRLTIPNHPRAGEYRLVVRVTEGRGRAALPVTNGTAVGQDEVMLRSFQVSADR